MNIQKRSIRRKLNMKLIMKGTTFRKEAVLRCVNLQYL